MMYEARGVNGARRKSKLGGRLGRLQRLLGGSRCLETTPSSQKKENKVRRHECNQRIRKEKS